MAFKLLPVAETHWRGIDAAELVPLVRARVMFEDGVPVYGLSTCQFIERHDSVLICGPSGVGENHPRRDRG